MRWIVGPVTFVAGLVFSNGSKKGVAQKCAALFCKRRVANGAKSFGSKHRYRIRRRSARKWIQPPRYLLMTDGMLRGNTRWAQSGSGQASIVRPHERSSVFIGAQSPIDACWSIRAIWFSRRKCAWPHCHERYRTNSVGLAVDGSPPLWPAARSRHGELQYVLLLAIVAFIDPVAADGA